MRRTKELQHSKPRPKGDRVPGYCCLPDEDWCEGCAANYRAWRDWLRAQRQKRRTDFLVSRSAS